jgi:hypothetical protein
MTAFWQRYDSEGRVALAGMIASLPLGAVMNSIASWAAICATSSTRRAHRGGDKVLFD